MRKFYLLPNSITAFGLCCGLFVIFKLFLADPAQDLFALLQSSTILLLIAGVADLADGAVARLVKGESEFGGQFDSLSDAVTFGVASPLVVLSSVPNSELSPFLALLFTIAAMIYTLCGILRLVRYNVRSREATLQEAIVQKRRYFTGLPIPTGAALIVSAALIMVSPFLENLIVLSAQTRAIIMICVLILSGYLMVSRWKFPSVAALHFRVPSFYLVFAIGVFGVLFLYGVLDYFPIAFFLASWTYMTVTMGFSICRNLFFPPPKVEPQEEEV
ncbi:MAG: CDP-alcohol phosphatidyltransferase family protein [Chlamydiales bacterium]